MVMAHRACSTMSLPEQSCIQIWQDQNTHKITYNRKESQQRLDHLLLVLTDHAQRIKITYVHEIVYIVSVFGHALFIADSLQLTNRTSRFVGAESFATSISLDGSVSFFGINSRRSWQPASLILSIF